MRWNAYADNPLGVVYIGVFYEGDYANANDGVRVAPGTYLVEVYEVPDNGTYSIPQSIYNHLPVGVRCSIFVGRVNGTELVNAQTGLSTAIHAVALDKKELMVVVD
ncbi:MAG TPA: hypothetical protein PKD90_08310 [Phnomibacter sp.]|nr:hypothetical protein [Phnomibacter sp.]